MFKTIAPLALIIWGLAMPAAAQKIENQMPAATCESTVTLSFPQPKGEFKVMSAEGEEHLRLRTTYYTADKKVRMATAQVKLSKGFKVYEATDEKLLHVLKDGRGGVNVTKDFAGLKQLVLFGAIDLNSLRLQTNSKVEGQWRLWWSFEWKLFEKPYDGPPRNSYKVKELRIGPQAVRHGMPRTKSTWDIRKPSGTEAETVTKWRTCISDIRGHRALPKKK